MRSAHRLRYIEATFWTVGLLAVAAADPTGPGLLSACPFDALGVLIGVDFCPGCGLGHAVGFLVRGELHESVRAHPLAVPAVGMLLIHIQRLVSKPQYPAS